MALRRSNEELYVSLNSCGGDSYGERDYCRGSAATTASSATPAAATTTAAGLLEGREVRIVRCDDAGHNERCRTKVLRALLFLCVVAGLSSAMPRTVAGQGRWALGGGLHHADVGAESGVLGVTADIGYRLGYDSRRVIFRLSWWDTIDALGAVGLYYGVRGKRRRFIYGDLGISAIREESTAGRASWRPAVGLAIAGVLDLGDGIELRAGGAQLWSAKKSITNVGLSICFCPGS